jgi:hypothetical protein
LRVAPVTLYRESGKDVAMKTIEQRMIDLLLESQLVSELDMNACRSLAEYDLSNETAQQAGAADLPKDLPEGRQHGTMYAYTHKGCRCLACRKAAHENYLVTSAQQPATLPPAEEGKL